MPKTARLCRGTGNFVSYSGRSLGGCFKCKGKGKLFFKHAAPVRAKARQQAADAKVRKAGTQWDRFAADNPGEAVWVLAKRDSFNFAASMYEAVTKYGDLTPGQLAAVQRMVAQDLARQQAAAARIINAPSVDISPLIASFNTARANHIKTPAMYLDTFKFKAAPMTGKNPGAIYVTEDEQYLGKIADGKLVVTGSCAEETKARIIAMCAQPLENAIAFGKRTGRCSCCYRELTNGESIELGIGPICRGRYGL